MSFIFCLINFSKKHPGAITKQNGHELRFSNLVFHNFRLMIFHDQKPLPLNFMSTSVSLRHDISTKIFLEYQSFCFF